MSQDPNVDQNTGVDRTADVEREQIVGSDKIPAVYFEVPSPQRPASRSSPPDYLSGLSAIASRYSNTPFIGTESQRREIERNETDPLEIRVIPPEAGFRVNSPYPNPQYNACVIRCCTAICIITYISIMIFISVEASQNYY